MGWERRWGLLLPNQIVHISAVPLRHFDDNNLFVLCHCAYPSLIIDCVLVVVVVGVLL